MTNTELQRRQEDLDDELCTWPSSPTLFTRANAIDQWPKPITALTQEYVGLAHERGIGASFQQLGVAEAGPPWTWNAVFYGWYVFNVESAASMADNLPGYDRTGVYKDYFGVSEDPDAPKGVGGGVNLGKVAGIGVNFVKRMRRYPKESEQWRLRTAAQLKADLALDFTTLSDAELLGRIERFFDDHVKQRIPHVDASVISAPMFEQVTTLVGKLTDDDPAVLVGQAVSGLGGIHLREATTAMAEVRAGRRSRESFEEAYGFRGSNEFELATRPWRESPDALERLIERSGEAASHVAEAKERRIEARARLKELSGLRWPMLRFQLGLAETHMRWRENGKVPLAQSVHSLRLAVRDAGRRLAERGVIAEPEDVVHLCRAELVAALRGDGTHRHDDVARRRRTWELSADLPLPEMVDADATGVREITPERWREVGVLPPAELDRSSPTLTGVGGSPGKVSGRARVVDDPVLVDLDEDEVIIASGTDSAWTPLFLQAVGVVVDVGGPMSHSSIAARELGIPCVVNVKEATTRIPDGATVHVDGDTGVVTWEE